ncbi:hypothetical protein [Actinacidiphila sp. ITFR-21]|uniref:hypothetical protein n=1 Tax=Actinacidiphila sp. ITFR-21 TaxID=3075199 RepID=UPI00288A271D|nr:hypothetical protein [Streptomyces sp. ITFR-21]WNI15558.1 hypothetical protein RLT57_08480 [Streptomyces sp. ITFR-21]
MPKPRVTRTYTPDQLEAIGVPHELPGPTGPEVAQVPVTVQRWKPVEAAAPIEEPTP